MTKVKLHFTLVGNSKAWQKIIANGASINWTNKDTFNYVVDTVADYFGNRSMIIANEKLLTEDAINYPKFYSAGWFISEDNTRELVVIGHGDTMDSANKLMMDSIKAADWEKSSVSI